MVMCTRAIAGGVPQGLVVDGGAGACFAGARELWHDCEQFRKLSEVLGAEGQNKDTVISELQVRVAQAGRKAAEASAKEQLLRDYIAALAPKLPSLPNEVGELRTAGCQIHELAVSSKAAFERVEKELGQAHSALKVEQSVQQGLLARAQHLSKGADEAALKEKLLRHYIALIAPELGSLPEEVGKLLNVAGRVGEFADSNATPLARLSEERAARQRVQAQSQQKDTQLARLAGQMKEQGEALELQHRAAASAASAIRELTAQNESLQLAAAERDELRQQLQKAHTTVQELEGRQAELDGVLAECAAQRGGGIEGKEVPPSTVPQLPQGGSVDGEQPSEEGSVVPEDHFGSSDEASTEDEEVAGGAQQDSFREDVVRLQREQIATLRRTIRRLHEQIRLMDGSIADRVSRRRSS